MIAAPRVSPRELVGEAIAALVSHRLRAALSAIGIVFGVATVITAFAIGEGARRAALDEIGSLGLDNIFVRSIAETVPGARRDRAPLAIAPSLVIGDAGVMAAIETAVAVAATRSAAVELHRGARRASGVLAGVDPSWRDVVDVEIAGGRWISEDDARARRRVAVVGADLSRDLFGGADPIGSRVEAAGRWFTIVGTLRASGAAAAKSAIQRLDVERSLLVPLAAMDVSLGAGDTVEHVQEIAMRLPSAPAVERAASILPRVLARRHGSAARFELVVPRELLRARLRAQRTFDAVLGSIGLLALVISGIGIMNIMLASVAERTAEVGIRRAFGARRTEIMAQFAIEAAVLCMAGGVLGVPLGAALSGLVALAAGWPVSISPSAVGIALLLATTVGIVFGIYPARMAAAIEPIDALRAP